MFGGGRTFAAAFPVLMVSLRCFRGSLLSSLFAPFPASLLPRTLFSVHKAGLPQGTSAAPARPRGRGLGCQPCEGVDCLLFLPSEPTF